METGAITAYNTTNEGFSIEGIATCRTTGASGTVMAQGLYKEYQNPAIDYGMTNTSADTIDTTVSNLLEWKVQWGVASASNTITVTNFLLEVLN